MHPFSILLARLALGGMWVTAGLAKLSQRGAGGNSVAAFGLLPRGGADAVGRSLPWVELTLGLLLLAGLRTTAAAAASAALLLLFSLAIVINLARGHRVECHCFGQIGRAPISWWSVARNSGLVVMALGLVLFRSQYLTLDGWWQGVAIRSTDPPALDFVPVLLLALTALVLWALAASAWEVATAVGSAEGGPALGLPERRYLRRRALAAGGQAVAADTSRHNKE
jgi:uncharacterized membrane protein YphA (DoxX/SURF4 family)